MTNKKLLFAVAGSLFALTSNSAHATLFGSIDFPDGVSSFADSVIQYNNLYSGGPAPTLPTFLDPTSATGAPDFIEPNGSVSLGNGGLIELAFTDNLLTNSGNSTFDLHVFEIGSDVEDTFVAIRPTASTLALLGIGALSDTNGDGYFEIGKVFGATSSIDIDAIALFSGYAPGALLFDAVQLIDDPAEGSKTGSTVGADIDAVGAIASAPNPTHAAVPEPITAALSLLGFTALAAATKRRAN